MSLAATPAPASVTPGPISPPDGFQAIPGVPLAQIVVTSGQPRDPTQPYAVVGSTLTAMEAVTAGQRDPTQPYAVVVTTTANQPLADWANPPAEAPRPVTYPASVRDMLTAAYPALLIVLVLGAVVSYFALLVLVAATFLLVPRVAFRVNQLRVVFYCLLGLTAAVWIVFALVNRGIYNYSFSVSSLAQILCVVGIVIDLGLQWYALRHGDKPASRPAGY